MTHSRYISFIAISGGLAWLAWILVLTNLSPYESLSLALTFFFVTLFIALTSTFTLLGFYFRLWLLKNEIYYKHINVALRQGVFLSLIAVFCLVLQMVRVLNWWSGLLIVFAAVLLEFYFAAKDSDY